MELGTVFPQGASTQQLLLTAFLVVAAGHEWRADIAVNSED